MNKLCEAGVDGLVQVIYLTKRLLDEPKKSNAEIMNSISDVTIKSVLK